MIDKRLVARISLRTPAKLLLGGAHVLAGWTENLSSSGLGLVASEQLTRGQSCLVIFHLTSAGGTRAISSKGRVAYSTPLDSGMFRVGLQFLDMEDVSVGIVEEFAILRTTDHGFAANDVANDMSPQAA